MSNLLEVKLLGKFDVSRDGRPISIPSRPAQSLFAYLILNSGTSHRREKLAGILGPDSLEETARDNLRHALWRLRKALEAGASTRFLKADDLSIGFNPTADYWLDASALARTDETAAADELTAVLHNVQGNYAQSRKLLEQSLGISRELGPAGKTESTEKVSVQS